MKTLNLFRAQESACGDHSGRPSFTPTWLADGKKSAGVRRWRECGSEAFLIHRDGCVNCTSVQETVWDFLVKVGFTSLVTRCVLPGHVTERNFCTGDVLREQLETTKCAGAGEESVRSCCSRAVECRSCRVSMSPTWRDSGTPCCHQRFKKITKH